jgi:hypothetical protein
MLTFVNRQERIQINEYINQDSDEGLERAK